MELHHVRGRNRRAPDGWTQASFAEGESARLASVDLDLTVASSYGEPVR